MSKRNSVSQSQESVSLEMDRMWRPVFERYDRNHDGRISCVEFERILKQGNDQLSEDIPPEVIDELIERSKWCDDKFITYEEFLKMVNARNLGSQRPRLQRLIRYAAMAVVPKSQRQSTIRRYLEEYNCYPPPLFMLAISIVEIVMFIYYCVQHKEFSAIGPVPFESVLIYNPCRRKEAWRYVTYMLIHAGFVHVFFNVLIQLILGIPLEMVHKMWRVGVIYLAGVAAGSLGASISDPLSFLAGASGGVYALITAHLASVVINWKEMEFRWIRLIALLVFGGTDVGVAIYGRYVEQQHNRTSYAAHLTGAIAGFLIGITVLRNLKKRRWEVIFGWFTLVCYVILMAFAIIFNIVNENHFINMENPKYCQILENKNENDHHRIQ